MNIISRLNEIYELVNNYLMFVFYSLIFLDVVAGIWLVKFIAKIIISILKGIKTIEDHEDMVKSLEHGDIKD
jgi:hypothetical protein